MIVWNTRKKNTRTYFNIFNCFGYLTQMYQIIRLLHLLLYYSYNKKYNFKMTEHLFHYINRNYRVCFYTTHTNKLEPKFIWFDCFSTASKTFLIQLHSVDNFLIYIIDVCNVINELYKWLRPVLENMYWSNFYVIIQSQQIKYFYLVILTQINDFCEVLSSAVFKPWPEVCLHKLLRQW